MKEVKEEKQHNLISLKFSITGKQTTIEKVNINQPLLVAVQKAFEETGTTRDIGDYAVKYNDIKLDINQKVETFNFLADAVIFISLISGQGGK